METIILAGGFGTRLKSLMPNIPKTLAPINNSPFLDYLFNYLIQQNIKKVILSVFYQYELIKKQYNFKYKNLDILYSIDSTALGTGGAIQKALEISKSDDIFVINGDTFFNIDLDQLFNEHKNKKNDITIALKPMNNFDRYGIIETDINGQILKLKEKQYCDYGKIDGGIYLINRSIFNLFESRKKFSFNDFIMNNLNNLRTGSLLCDELFIDIGTPEDLEKAHLILKDY